MVQFIRKQFLLVTLLLFCFVSVLGQDRLKYQGPMQVGSYMGKANYQYILADNDTLYDGPFQVQKSSLEALLDKKDVSFLFKGNFEQGLTNGDWKFQFGEFQSESKSQVVEYEYRVLISGTQEEGLGSMLDGKLDGKWTYTVSKIKDSEIEKTLFKSSFAFEKGIPQQNFQIENDSLTMVGRFLRNGLAQDEWSCFSENAIDDTESWFFEEGILKKIRVIKDGIVNEVPFFDGAGSYSSVRLDASFLALLEATAMTKDQVLNSKIGIGALLIRNEQFYQKMDTVVNKLGSTDFLPKFQVQVPYYPLDSLNTIAIEQISADYVAAKALSQELLTNSHLNIVRRSDVDAEYNFQLAKAISQNFLTPVEKLVKYQELDIIKHLKVSEVIPRLWPNGKPSTAISIDQKVFELPNASQFNFNGNDLVSIRQLIAYGKLSLEEIRKNLSHQLTNDERVQALNTLEKDLIAANDTLIQQIDSATTILPKAYKKALESIQALAENSLKVYAEMQNPQEKLAYGTGLKTCLSELSELTNSLIGIPGIEEEILLLYQDAIWNPFMATVMDEEVKKRITTAYSNILIPYFIESISETVACENAMDLNNQIVHTHERMRVLREADTKKLERKLRREKNPTEILKLLHQRTQEDK